MDFVDKPEIIYLFVSEIRFFISASLVFTFIMAVRAFVNLIYANRNKIWLASDWISLVITCLALMFCSSHILQFFVRISLESGNPDMGKAFNQWFLPIGIMALFWLVCAILCSISMRKYIREIKEAKNETLGNKNTTE